jgi:biopolymer transport protein ExbB
MNVELAKELVDWGVMGILALMGFVALWAYFERLLFFRRIDLGRYRHKEALDIDLTANITLISSVGSNAPYVGLLGTVVAIPSMFFYNHIVRKIEVLRNRWEILQKDAA